MALAPVISMTLNSDVWSGFSKDLKERTVHFTGELASGWKDLSGLIEVQRQTFASVTGPDRMAGRPQDLEAFFANAAPALLADPLAAYGQKRPLQRSIGAMEEHESSVVDLLRRLPRVDELTGKEIVEITGIDRRSPRGIWRSLRQKRKAIHLRDVISSHFQSMVLERAALDGAFQLVLAETALHLLVPWQTLRRAFLSEITQSEHDRTDLDGARRWWTDVADRLQRRATALLTRYDTWAESISPAVAKALVRRPYPTSQRRRISWDKEHQRHISFWSRQQRAVRSVIDLELHLSSLAQIATRETITSIDALDLEHTELIQELDAAIGWLEQWHDRPDSKSFPQPKARLLSCDERLAEWLRRTSGAARQELAVAIETVEPRTPLPGWRKPWRDLEPARVFLAALSAAGAPIMEAGLREAEAVHRAVVREIERAREVVEFGFETAHLERGASQAFAGEAVRNALTLLTFQKGVTSEIRPAAENSAAHAIAAVLLECGIALERNRIGLLAHVTRRRGREAFRQLRGVAEKGIQTASRRVWAGARHAYRWALLKIGWIASPRQAAVPVIRRADLGEALEVQFHARNLPMIYRRLFRLAPVEDPRFLVGREAEMAGFADALQSWQAGKGASVIVVGARGSGKTSLINCAATGVFAQCELVRGQFCERLQTQEQMTGFVRALLKVATDVDVTAALGERRRVVLVEEFERTFLRTVNGFAALRVLLDLMYSTGRSTLWVFSVNETAYRYLNAVVGLGRHFSHRINAMSVRQEDLTSAILQRHGLSGLRLEFAPLPEEDPRVSGVRRFLGFEQDPQRLFLDALYEQSEGIFRAAFELWQGSIERVEGGVVHMRQPLAPDYLRLAAEMTLEDCFMLKAILQHGSLTAEELAHVLATTREETVRQLERLNLLEVLEPEPAGPGVRVRPEAGKLVRETLSRRNLL